MHYLVKKAVAIFKYAFGGFILAGALLYLVLAFLNRELGVRKYGDEFLAATLFWVVALMLVQANILGATQKSIALTQLDTATLAQAAIEADAMPEVRFYQGDEVYEATRRAVSQARDRVWVTYLRSEGPQRSAAAERHFQAYREWALASPGHSFRRIILHSESPAMSDFYKAELQAARQADFSKRKYQVKLLQESKHATEAFSVGIYDDLVIFTHNDGPDRTFAVSIQSEKLAQDHIKEYYLRLLGSESYLPHSRCLSGDPRIELLKFFRNTNLDLNRLPASRQPAIFCR